MQLEKKLNHAIKLVQIEIPWNHTIKLAQLVQLEVPWNHTITLVQLVQLYNKYKINTLK